MKSACMWSLAAAILLLGGALPAAAQTKPVDGKALFLAQKCNMCHSVSVAGIERTTKSEKMAGADLSDAAAAPMKDLGSVTKYVRGETDMGGKKHPRKFTGSDEELGAILGWLQTQRKK